MDLGSPSRRVAFSELEAHLPQPLDEEKRRQCSACCALRMSAYVFVGATIFGIPFNGIAHGFRSNAPIVARKPFVHPLSKKDASAASVANSKFVTTEGGGLYAKAAAEGGMDAFLGGYKRTTINPLGTLGGTVKASTLSQKASRSGMRNTVTYFADRYLFHSLPLAAVALTHQYILSSLLWSKSEKGLFVINMGSVVANTVLWLGIGVLGRVFHRRVILPRSGEARMAMFEYDRVMRVTGHWYRPFFSGQLTEHFAIKQLVWVLVVYSGLWSVATLVNEHLYKNHYSMFHGFFPSYSKNCAPRWREWRENELRKQRSEVDNTRVLQQMGQQPDDKVWGLRRMSRSVRVQ